MDDSRESTVAPAAANDRPMKSSSRKSHRKTRTGCRTCKQRKIKCDESKPQCNNCIKHSVRCDFLAHNTPSESSPTGGPFTQANTPSSTSTPNAGNLPGLGRITSDGQHGLHPLGLNLNDLELLHNYSTHTASTLHSDTAVKTLLRISVPQLGLTHDFVMRGALAISALHLARFKPEKRDFYLSQAVHHQEIGLRTATSIIPNITEENCSAVYIFSVFTFYSALAKPRQPGDFLIVGENGVADWLFLVKGTSYIMESSYSSLQAGPFGPLFKAGGRRYDMREAHAAEIPLSDEPVDELRELIHRNITDQHNLPIYDIAIDGLRKSFVMVNNQGLQYEIGDIFVWLFQASDGYLQLLRQHTAESLVILAYFCALLKRLDHYWWIEGWSTHLISKIFYLLDQEHRLWMRWPIEEVGWIPN